MRALFVDAAPGDFRHDDFFAVDAAFGENLAARRDEEALPPELDSRTARRSFVADAIHRGDVAAIRDRVTALHRFPARVLRLAVFLLLGGMPADRGGIKDQLRTAQRGQARSFRIPLIPANAHSDVSLLRRPGFESEIAGREVKLLVERRVIRDVHLAIFAEELAV